MKKPNTGAADVVVPALEQLHKLWHANLEAAVAGGADRYLVSEAMHNIGMAHLLRIQGPRELSRILRQSADFLERQAEAMAEEARAVRRAKH